MFATHISRLAASTAVGAGILSGTLAASAAGPDATDAPTTLTNFRHLREPTADGAANPFAPNPAGEAFWHEGVVLPPPAAGRGQPSPPFVLETDATYMTAFGDQFYGAVTAGPGEYFAVWVDLRVGGANPAGYDLYGQRIRPDGTLAAPGSLELLRDWSRMTTGIPGVAWNGSIYLVVWNEGSTLYAMRVSAEGEVIDPGGFVLGSTTTSLRWPSVASDGTDFLVVQPSGGSVLGWRVGAEDTDVTPLMISSGASGLGYPKVTFAAGVYLVTWAQAPNQAIRAARVTPAGAVLDPGGVNISGGGTDVDAHVDFDGENFYVVWQRLDGQLWDLWGAHVSPQAEVVSGPTLLLDGNSWGYVSSGQVAFNGTHHLITITTSEPIFSNTDLYALRVDAEGSPVGGPFPVSTLEGRSQVAFGVASVGDQFFVLWEGNLLSGVYFIYDTEGARIDAAGNVLDRPQQIVVSTSAAWQLASTSSFDGNNFLAVFEDWRPGGGLSAVRVTPEGVPLEAAAVTVARQAQGRAEHPDATFGGGQHVVVFENWTGAISQVRMVRVLPDGTLLDPNSILVFSNEPTADTFRPKVAWNGQHYCVVWYDNYLPPGQKPLQFALVAIDGSVAVGPVSVSTTDGASLNAFEITSNGDEFLLAWVGYNSVNVTRISATGQELVSRVVQNTGNWITDLPEVAFNGQSYLIAWRQWGDGGVRVYAKRVNQDGFPVGSLITVAGPAGLVAPVGAFAVGSDFAVTGWTEVGSDFALFIAWYDAAGALIGEPEVLVNLLRDDTYAGSSALLTAEGTLLLVHSLWASNPYNAPRAHGQIVELLGGPPGDLNGDGTVDFDDLLILLAAYGFCDGDAGFNPAADLDADGCIGFGDLVILLSNYGT